MWEGLRAIVTAAEKAIQENQYQLVSQEIKFVRAGWKNRSNTIIKFAKHNT